MTYSLNLPIELCKLIHEYNTLRPHHPCKKLINDGLWLVHKELLWYHEAAEADGIQLNAYINDGLDGMPIGYKHFKKYNASSVYLVWNQFTDMVNMC
jgi:hypothetical protein